ncbi:MAG: hypothetical protein IKZ07_01865 [Akkermansia sp.]|nr:hypothetical protein [Akkermansia sp.]
MKKSCILLALLPLIVVPGGFVFFFNLIGETIKEVAEEPVPYSCLHEPEQDSVPPFARNIYRAYYAHWQVFECAWRFDMPPGNEDQLKQWVNAKGGQAVNVAQFCELRELPPPSWWSRPADARLVSNRQLDGGLHMSMWFSGSANRVWILYER